MCHVADTATLYVEILRKILAGEDIGYGKNGYYLASAGSIAWDDIYSVMAKALAKRQIIEDEEVHSANDEVLERMSVVLGIPKVLVPVMLGGR